MSGTVYLVVKALHIISVIAWMAGMLYLPRLFVYHADAKAGGELSQTLKVMERRLLKLIINPAMIAAWLLGLTLVGILGVGSIAGQGWFWVKLAAVLALSGVHGMLARHVKRFAADANDKPARYFRILNEAPTLLLIVIVFMVIMQPF